MKILLQNDSPRTRGLIDLTIQHHTEWCAENGWSYILDYSAGKWASIRNSMGVPDGSTLVWLDADAVVVGSLDDALSEDKDIGLTKWLGFHGKSFGVMYMRVGARVREFISDVAMAEIVAKPAKTCAAHGGDEVSVLCKRPKNGLCERSLPLLQLHVEELDSKWNASDPGTEDLRVIAWHGMAMAEKAEAMAKFMDGEAGNTSCDCCTCCTCLGGGE